MQDFSFLTFSPRGMETKLWHSTLISALMFLTYEKIQRLVENAIIAKVAKKSKVN